MLRPIRINIRGTFKNGTGSHPILRKNEAVGRMVTSTVSKGLGITTLPNNGDLLRNDSLFIHGADQVFRRNGSIIRATRIHATAIRRRATVQRRDGNTTIPLGNESLRKIRRVFIIMNSNGNFMHGTLVTTLYHKGNGRRSLQLIQSRQIYRSKLLLRSRLQRRSSRVRVTLFTIRHSVKTVP